MQKLNIPQPIDGPGVYLVEFLGVIQMGASPGCNHDLIVIWRLLDKPYNQSLLTQCIADDRDDQGQIRPRTTLRRLVSILTENDKSPEISLGAYVGLHFRLTIVAHGESCLLIRKIERIGETLWN